MTGLLIDYNFQQHVASDIGVGDKFLPSENYNIQEYIHQISDWTNENLMKMNPNKCNYMIFTRSKENISTRLELNGTILERKHTQKILGQRTCHGQDTVRRCAERHTHACVC